MQTVEVCRYHMLRQAMPHQCRQCHVPECWRCACLPKTAFCCTISAFLLRLG